MNVKLISCGKNMFKATKLYFFNPAYWKQTQHTWLVSLSLWWRPLSASDHAGRWSLHLAPDEGPTKLIKSQWHEEIVKLKEKVVSSWSVGRSSAVASSWFVILVFCVCSTGRYAVNYEWLWYRLVSFIRVQQHSPSLHRLQSVFFDVRSQFKASYWLHPSCWVGANWSKVIWRVRGRMAK